MNSENELDPRDERAWIAPDRVRELSTLSHRGLLHIGLEWGAIGGAACLCWQLWHPALYVLTVMFIGARQHALALLVHDGAHYRLTANRRWNDWISETLCAWPLLLTTTRAYRRNHRAHHRWTHTDRDPDLQRKQTPEWRFPQRAWIFVPRLLSYAFGLGVWRLLTITRTIRGPRAEETPADATFARARAVWLVAAAALVTFAIGWRAFLLFWVVPLATWFQLVFQVRSIAEHFAVPERPGPLGVLRTTLPSWFDSIFVVPKNGGFHAEHHLYPSVPFYNLKALHRELMANDEYRSRVHVSHGYARAMLECVG